MSLTPPSGDVREAGEATSQGSRVLARDAHLRFARAGMALSHRASGCYPLENKYR